MKILHFSSEYPPQQVFGLGRFVHDLAIAQAAAGDEVHVVTNSLRGDEHGVVKRGVHIHRVSFPPPPKPHLGTIVVTQFNVQLIARAAALIEQIQPDVLNLHDWLTIPAGLPIAATFGLPVIFTVHDTVNGKRFGQLDDEDRYVAALERWGTHHADRVICCSQFVRDELTTTYEADANRIRIVPCGVDAGTFEVQARPEHLAAFRTVLAGPDDPLVVYLGRLDREKGLEVLINAVPAILAQHPTTRFAIIGKGQLGASLQRHVQQAGWADRFIFPGYVNGEPLAQVLRVADVMAIPSTYEPFGIVALEGMVNGLPVVVPDTTGLAEIVEHDSDGLHFEAGLAHSLADRINRLLSDSDLRTRLGDQARRKALEHFHWPGIAGRTRAVYAEVIGAEARNADALPLRSRFPESTIQWGTPRAALSAPAALPRVPHERTAVIVIVHDRLALTRRCLSALTTRTYRPHEILVVDTGSSAEVLAFLTDALHQGAISRLLANAPGTLPQWQKGGAIAQAVRLLTDEHVTHIAWLDNDVEVRPGWLGVGLDVLESLPESELPVVSLCSGDAQQREAHPTQETREICGRTVRIAPTANGALWLMRRSFFGRFGLPPIGEGLSQSAVEDWHYCLKLREAGCRFALVDDVAEHLGQNDSARERAYSDAPPLRSQR